MWGLLKRLLKDDTSKVIGSSPPRDGRDPDPTKSGIFVYHHCWKCNDGDRPCVRKDGKSYLCEYPHARND
jgi:hypothetical protein